VFTLLNSREWVEDAGRLAKGSSQSGLLLLHQLPPESVCVKHQCIICCHGTEMALLEEDIRRIEELGFVRGRFSVEYKGLTVLMNNRGRCVFHDGERCTIYSSRPAGCRLYPVVFDENIGAASIDILCPYSTEFLLTPSATRESLSLYRAVIEDARARKKKRRKNQSVLKQTE